jgi:hypothetical protein
MITVTAILTLTTTIMGTNIMIITTIIITITICERLIYMSWPMR